MHHSRFLLGIFAVALLVIGMAGCDTVDQPFKNAINVDWASVVYADTVSQTESAVFIEDFTGHTCKNCPKATKVLVKLDSLFGDRVVPLAIHARGTGFSNVDTTYPTDFTSEASESLWNYFGPAIGLPNGMVQRADYPTNHWKSYTTWQTRATTWLSEAPTVLFETVPGWNDGGRQAVLQYKLKAAKTHPNPIHVAFYLTESGVVSTQLMPDNSKNRNYVHNHFLRAAPKGILGLPLLAANAAANTQQGGWVAYEIPAAWKADKMDWIAVAYDAVTYQVLQAVAVPVRP
jgi:hypothetical protein